VNAFETNLNRMLVETFNYILKYEEMSLRNILNVQVTITEAHMLEAVGRYEKDEATVSKIASVLGIAMPTATVAVQKLEIKGFIKKVPCEKDARRAIISLTDTGKRIEKAHHLFHEKMVKNISSQIADGEKDLLLRAIKTLSDFFKAKVEA